MLFNFYDVDGDGTLSLEEFKLACQVPAHPRAAIHPMCRACVESKVRN